MFLGSWAFTGYAGSVCKAQQTEWVAAKKQAIKKNTGSFTLSTILKTSCNNFISYPQYYPVFVLLAHKRATQIKLSIATRFYKHFTVYNCYILQKNIPLSTPEHSVIS